MILLLQQASSLSSHPLFSCHHAPPLFNLPSYSTYIHTHTHSRLHTFHAFFVLMPPLFFFLHLLCSSFCKNTQHHLLHPSCKFLFRHSQRQPEQSKIQNTTFDSSFHKEEQPARMRLHDCIWIVFVI